MPYKSIKQCAMAHWLFRAGILATPQVDTHQNLACIAKVAEPRRGHRVAEWCMARSGLACLARDNWLAK